MSIVRTRLLTGFLDSEYDANRWQQLLPRGDTNTIFQTWHWLRAWWEAMGKGELLLVAAERGADPVALAPLYTVEGMVYFVGSGESDYLDFIGDISDSQILDSLLSAARERVANFLGFEFFLMPDASRTERRLDAAAARLGLECVLLKEYPAVDVDLVDDREAVERAISHSMLKKEDYFRRRGPLQIKQMNDAEAIREHLSEFYAQHIARWGKKAQPSPFSNSEQRAFLERFLEVAAETDWVRFLEIELGGRSLAFEFAWYYGNTHYSGPWCFSIEEANHSPGHVLLRQSLSSAVRAGLRRYDLGIGDQEYKLRLPARIKTCRSWGLYPP